MNTKTDTRTCHIIFNCLWCDNDESIYAVEAKSANGARRIAQKLASRLKWTVLSVEDVGPDVRVNGKCEECRAREA